MPEWEAFDFRQFLKNGYFVSISKMVRIIQLLFDNLSHAEVSALYLQS